MTEPGASPSLSSVSSLICGFRQLDVVNKDEILRALIDQYVEYCDKHDHDSVNPAVRMGQRIKREIGNTALHDIQLLDLEIARAKKEMEDPDKEIVDHIDAKIQVLQALVGFIYKAERISTGQDRMPAILGI